jgi:hypothetical protein
MNAYLKTGAMVLLTALTVLGALIVAPQMFNQGWVGFFTVPIFLFAVGAGLVIAWHRFLKFVSKLGEKNEKAV